MLKRDMTCTQACSSAWHTVPQLHLDIVILHAECGPTEEAHQRASTTSNASWQTSAESLV
jgi:hypothetical protein